MTYQDFQQQYQEAVNYIWQHMSVDNTGGVFMHKDNQTIKYENLKYINKDGKSYIHDSASGRLYDQMFNYYQDGRYYNPFGQLVQDVEDPNIIDGTFRDITDVPPRSKFSRYDDVFINYGRDSFDKSKFQPIKNHWIKPDGGFWASPINTERGWKQSIENEGLIYGMPEDYMDKSIEFKINKNARVLNIESVSDLDGLPTLSNGFMDFETLAKDYDAMYVDLSKGGRELHMDQRIYGYDVDSLLVFNPDIVEPIEVNRPIKPKYKPVRGPKLKEKEEINTPNRRKYKPVRGPKLKEKAVQEATEAALDTATDKVSKMVTKQVSDAGQEAIEKVAASIPSGGGGKYVALALGALAIGYAAGSDKKKEPVKTQRAWNAQNRISYDVPINDPQAMQMAQAMSQYRYGSRLPGFN